MEGSTSDARVVEEVVSGAVPSGDLGGEVGAATSGRKRVFDSSSSQSGNSGTAKISLVLKLRLFASLRIAYLDCLGKYGTGEWSARWAVVSDWGLRHGLEHPSAAEHGRPVDARVVIDFARFMAMWSMADTNPSGHPEDVSYDSLRKKVKDCQMLGKGFKYAKYLVQYDFDRKRLDRQAFDVYLALCEKYGETTTYAGTSTTERVLGVRFARLCYWEESFFKTVVPGRECSSTPFRPNAFVLAMRLAVDGLCHGRTISGEGSKRARRYITTDTGRGRRKNLKVVKPYENTCVAVEMIVYAWDRFSRSFGFSGVEEMVKPFLYYCLEKCALAVLPEDRCVPKAERDDVKSFAVYGLREGVATVAEFGVACSSEHAPLLIRGLNEHGLAVLRRLSSQFVGHVNDVGASPQVVSAISGEDVMKMEDMLGFVLPNSDEAPVGVFISEEDASVLRGALLEARVSCREAVVDDEGDVEMDEVGGWVRPAVVPALGADTRRTGHVCAAGTCECESIRDEIQTVIDDKFAIFECGANSFISVCSEDPGAATIVGSVQLVLTDPPYNVRRTSNKKNSDHDCLGEDGMDEVVKTCVKLLRPGGHVVIFCSHQQFPIWEEKLTEKKEVGSETARAFSVSSVPLVFIPEKCGRRGMPYRVNVTHRGITECAVHAVRTGMSKEEGVKMVEWIPHGHVVQTHPVYFNVVDNVPGLGRGERIGRGMYADGEEEAVSNGDCMVRPEQKSVKLFMELIKRYSRGGDVVVDLFGGTFTTAAACASLTDYRRFYGCDNDDFCVRVGRIRTLNAFVVSYVRDGFKNGIVVPEGGMGKMRKLLEKNKYNIGGNVPLTSGGRFQSNSCEAQRVLNRTQVLPSVVLTYLANELDDHRYVRPPFCNTPPDMWDKVHFGRLNELCGKEVRKMLAASSGLIVGEGRNVHVGKIFSKGALVGAVGGTVVYGAWKDSVGNGTARALSLGMFGCSMEAYTGSRISVLAMNTRFEDRGVCVRKMYLVPNEMYPLARVRISATGYNAEIRVKSCKVVTCRVTGSEDFVRVYAVKFMSVGDEVVISDKVIFV